MLGNTQIGATRRTVPQRTNRRWRRQSHRQGVKRCGKSAPASGVTRVARQTPPGARPDRGRTARPGSPPGGLLEPAGNRRSRGMAAPGRSRDTPDRIRRTGRLRHHPLWHNGSGTLGRTRSSQLALSPSAAPPDASSLVKRASIWPGGARTGFRRTRAAGCAQPPGRR